MIPAGLNARLTTRADAVRDPTGWVETLPLSWMSQEGWVSDTRRAECLTDDAR